MSTQTTVRTEELTLTTEVTPSADSDRSTVVSVEAQTLNELLCRVHEDSKRDARAYLEECHVPHGGE